MTRATRSVDRVTSQALTADRSIVADCVGLLSRINQPVISLPLPTTIIMTNYIQGRFHEILLAFISYNKAIVTVIIVLIGREVVRMLLLS